MVENEDIGTAPAAAAAAAAAATAVSGVAGRAPYSVRLDGLVVGFNVSATTINVLTIEPDRSGYSDHSCAHSTAAAAAEGGEE
jgi:hypothetical protein